MEETIKNKEKIQVKSVALTPKIHFWLSNEKLRKGLRNIEDVIKILISSHNKLKILEIKEQREKQSKNGKTNTEQES
jgi:hypothetical protein